MNMNAVIKVLVVDDSALTRQVLSEIIAADPRLMLVGTAAEPYEARAKIKALAPDVITLDIEMPKMDGITFLRNLMRLHPLPVVMLSMLTAKGADVTLQALELGAVDFIQKPQWSIEGELSRFAHRLNEKIVLAGGLKSRLIKRVPLGNIPAAVDVSNASTPDWGSGQEVIAVGASTGGIEALTDLLHRLPADIPPVVVVQHIPATFSQRFAKRLNQKILLQVVEAQHGQVLQRGCVYIAPGSQHLRIARKDNTLTCVLTDDVPVNRHKPSVEVLFDSVASANVAKVIAVLLTGMGDDGAKAMLRLRQSGAYTIAQDQASSLVWGMPKVAVQLGAACETTALANIPHSIVRRLR